MSAETIGLLVNFLVAGGGMLIVGYFGYRLKKLSDESKRLTANEAARKAADANLQELKDLPAADFDDRADKWVRRD